MTLGVAIVARGCGSSILESHRWMLDEEHPDVQMDERSSVYFEVSRTIRGAGV